MTMPESYRLFVALAVALVAFGVTSYLINWSMKPASAIASISLEDTISDIKRELQKLEDTPGQTLGLTLSEVKIALLVQEENAYSSNAHLTVPVFDEAKIGTSERMTGQTGSKITVVLVPQGSQLLSAGGGSSLKFADLLVAAREALRRSIVNEPKLEAKSIDVELAFVLTAERSNSTSVKAKIISVGTASDQKETSSNTVTLTYLNPKHQKKDTGSNIVPP